MQNAHLQLESFLLIVAALNNALLAKGIMNREEIDWMLRDAEEMALADSDGGTGSTRDAVIFPMRILRLANNDASDGQIRSFSDLARLVDRMEQASLSAALEGNELDPSEVLFYTSENGDKWALVTDVGDRQFVRHTPTPSSGGEISLIDLQSFRERDRHSSQNQELERLLSTHS